MQRNGPRASDGSDVATGRVTCNQDSLVVTVDSACYSRKLVDARVDSFRGFDGFDGGLGGEVGGCR